MEDDIEEMKSEDRAQQQEARVRICCCCVFILTNNFTDLNDSIDRKSSSSNAIDNWNCDAIITTIIWH